MKSKELYLSKVLTDCNRIRGLLHHKPVDTLLAGKRGKMTACPVANTINFGVKALNCKVWLSIGGFADAGVWIDWCSRIDPAALLVDFGRRFDRGDFPELEEV